MTRFTPFWRRLVRGLVRRLFDALTSDEGGLLEWTPKAGTACDATGARLGDATKQKPHPDWNRRTVPMLKDPVNLTDERVLTMTRRKKA